MVYVYSFCKSNLVQLRGFASTSLHRCSNPTNMRESSSTWVGQPTTATLPWMRDGLTHCGRLGTLVCKQAVYTIKFNYTYSGAKTISLGLASVRSQSYGRVPWPKHLRQSRERLGAYLTRTNHCRSNLDQLYLGNFLREGTQCWSYRLITSYI